MFNAQNKQLHSYLPTSFRHKLLKFCYFMIPLFMFSCDDSKSEKTTEDQQAVEQTEAPAATQTSSKTILCFGDSITAGYGLDDSADAFPALLQQKIDSLDLNYTVINSGVSGETTAGGKSRIDWVIKQNVDLFLLELGANDGLRGVALSETRSNLQAIIDVVKEKSPETTIILAGMELPPNMGQDYTTEFRELYADLAEKNNVEFIPFILKDVGGIASLNQSDGIHPNVEGHKILADTVWETLGPLVMR
ncbi:acyl-CoA thioesterase-1 [Gelidibacter algens]|uniref:Acyl-CoA thioesterase-1 n=1 Tax=Gelidibacter algens TaxID=49280 RepID=A0A1A7R4T1_9FLAO|nr:arylesterase [Gelidibacter algens]OBX26479.1 arylesterase [Gelidibacter algens]RAJ26703.1 acyl-CoA thioesterase-1 [Gelidibacter algens]